VVEGAVGVYWAVGALTPPHSQRERGWEGKREGVGRRERERGGGFYLV
jgi:hypothetical protein